MTDGGNWGQWFVNCAVTANNLTVKGTDTLGATLVFGDYTGAATNKFVGTGITGTLTVGDSHTSYTTYLQSNGSNDFGTGSGASPQRDPQHRHRQLLLREPGQRDLYRDPRRAQRRRLLPNRQ